MVRVYRELVRGKDGKDFLRRNFHDGQTKVWLSNARFPVFLAGTQSGKTCFAPDWLEREIIRKGPGDYLAITATFPLLNLKLLPEFRYFFESLLKYGEYKQQRGSHVILFHRESSKGKVIFTDEDYERAGVQETRIIFGSATNPESIESATAKGAVLDECLAPETLIDTEKGKISISDIVNKKMDMRVWSYDTKSAEWSLKSILRWIKLPQNKPLLTIGDLRLTGNHKIWTAKGYVKAEGLVTSDNNAILKAEVMRYGKARSLFRGDSSENERCCEPTEERVVFSEWMDVSPILKQNGGILDRGMSGDGYVYNLKVEGNHNYIAEGILVSNCGQKQWKRDSWEAVLRRLSLAKGRALLITTLYGYGWLKTEVYDEWLKGNHDFDVIQVDSIVNPAFPVEEYERAKKAMPAWKFDLFYRGRYSKPAGMIYDCFDADCIVDKFSIPSSWPVYVGHDFGTNNMASVWLAQDPTTGYLYIFNEYLAGGLATHEHIYQWNQTSKGLRIIKKAGGAVHEDGWRDTFGQAGWHISKPSVSSVEEGIQKVYSLFKTRKAFVCRDCLSIIDDLQSYSYELDDNYNPTDKIINKDRYHLLDALRSIASDFNPIDNIGTAVETRWDDEISTRQLVRR